ncbi:monosaccharide ABC transporter ATP-binding protein (CUT2 family) [Lachnotalea glycerini]|uniref:Monosaccharide ABC transporter ATP-binding protein (CUT2 family) n=1 Tax=Lachnotalea glycerini TaxID=1763509 RepID=A0A318ET94_9FIRM|nr:sugar ABC transporter ATP-binding protein [Lachnotalea glycerini]PXV95492.1 monosaccharide ABC transporter ATP-binding protein (CUT2 family) [Lachnotalea glycerini]RDY32812.1 sugar ABC transporter ATP-binding protein [Lachnotalea glycerini]
MSDRILQMEGISKSFFGVQVLKNAQLEVRKGEVHVLLGENGAGKSTMIKILSGAYKREEGKIYLNGEELPILTPKEVIDKGISVIYQEFNLNPHVSIWENIFMGKEFTKHGIIDSSKSKSEAKKYMELIGLDCEPDLLVGNLSIAQKQMVEIAKAISMDVKVLVLDEPTASITDKETERLFSIVRELKAKGIGIIYISHRMSELFEIGDRCSVMRDGEYIDTVELSKTSVEELTKMMVGRSVSFERYQNKALDTKSEVLKVENLNYKKLLKNVSFHLHKGEILGMSGLVGAGRTELAKCIIGAYTKSSGTVYLNGNEYSNASICKSIDHGIVYLSEDRKDEGLVLMHSLKDNIALPNLSLFGKFMLSKSKMECTAKESVEKLMIKAHSTDIQAKNLSGGNQQKVVIAKWLLTNAQIFIFDEPTRGIDVGARDEIYQIMGKLVKEGKSIIMISSDIPEIQKMCDRVLVLKDGEITADVKNTTELTQEKILSYALTGGK